MIRERRKQLENGDATAENDLLSILFSMEDEHGLKLSAKDIYHQVFTFLISGHETTSLTIMWTLYLLAKHPDIQTEVRQEISRFINPPCAEITWEQIERMKLLDNCIKEAMRLYPVAITTDRTSIGADTLGPHKILPGTHVMVGTGTLHRDEEFWKDPDTFNPCRFDEIGIAFMLTVYLVSSVAVPWIEFHRTFFKDYFFFRPKSTRKWWEGNVM